VLFRNNKTQGRQGAREERERGLEEKKKIVKTKDRVLVQYQSSTPHQIRSHRHLPQKYNNNINSLALERQRVAREIFILKLNLFTKPEHSVCVREEIKVR
jgi:hypothetical protein